MIIRYSHDFINNQDISNYIIILGYSSFLINLVLNTVLLMRMVQKKETGIKPWLLTTNLLFFIVQLFIFFT